MARYISFILFTVGYNANTIKSQYSVRPIAGNVRGGEKWNIIDNTSTS